MLSMTRRFACCSSALHEPENAIERAVGQDSALLQKQLDQVSAQMTRLAEVSDYLVKKIAKLSALHDDMPRRRVHSHSAPIAGNAFKSLRAGRWR